MKKIKTFIKNLLKKNKTTDVPDATPLSDEDKLELLLNLIKAKLEMEYDNLFENELPTWNKPSKEIKQEMLGIIGKSWLTNTDVIKVSKVNK